MLQKRRFLEYYSIFWSNSQLLPNPNLDFKQIQIWINKIIVLLLNHLYLYPLWAFLSNQQCNS